MDSHACELSRTPGAPLRKHPAPGAASAAQGEGAPISPAQEPKGRAGEVCWLHALGDAHTHPVGSTHAKQQLPLIPGKSR